MRITILGKKDSMKINPNMNLRGISRNQYTFVWDQEAGFYCYRPKNQGEVDDIFQSIGRIYHTIRLSVLLDEKKEETPKRKPGRPKKEETLAEAEA